MINYPNQNAKYGQTPQGPQTALGQAMPDVLKTPVLTNAETTETTDEASIADESSSSTTSNSSAPINTLKVSKLSMIEEGITFTGNATLQGACTIAGQLVGNLKEHAGANSQIVITETGSVKGDVFSSKVSVMGHASGTIDASGGSVDLHAKSVVSGHIRYGQLQVNGADLNATLERVAKPAA